MTNPLRLHASLPALLVGSLLFVACQGARHAPRATVPPCTSEQLALAELGSDAGAGSRALHLTLRNISARTCTLKGDVEMRLLDVSGHPLAGVTVNPAEEGSQTHAASEPITLSPGRNAWFLLIYPSATGGQPCHAVTSIEVTPPSGGPALRLDRGFDVCGPRVTMTSLQSPRTAP